MRSPYDIYAKRVLRLVRLDPLGAQPDAKERGSMIHKVFERFVHEGFGFRSDDALGALERMKIGAGTPKAGLSKWLSSYAAASAA